LSTAILKILSRRIGTGKSKLAQATGADNWQDKDFTTKHNEILKLILECDVSDPPIWTDMSKIWALPSQSEVDEVNNTEVSETSRTAKNVRGVAIEEEIFIFPHSAILCLEGISHFLRLIGSIPSMTSDITMSLISYLQIFDSRCRQLVLGAAAMRSAGLKNITMKHLALTSRALSFIATIIPHVREFVRRHTPPGPKTANLLGEFGKVRHAFQEHQDSIYQKMAEVMKSRARAVSRKVLETEWEKENPENVRGYMVDLAMDTGRLYKVVTKYLPEQAAELVMDPVFASYRDELGRALKEADPNTNTGRDWYDYATVTFLFFVLKYSHAMLICSCSMLRDADHLVGKLGNVKGFGDLGTYLMNIIKKKEIKMVSPIVPPPMPTMVAEGEEIKRVENTEGL
jgi:vacuolar protein sorting-associated protein 54